MILENSYVPFLIEHGLTQNQYLLLHLLHKGRNDLIKDYKEKFPSDDGTMIGKYWIQDLVNKGFLAEDKVNFYKLTEKFYSIFINKHTATDQIYDIYPTTCIIDGASIPLTAFDRNIFANLYDNYTNSSIKEHLEIIKDIEFAKDHDLIKIGIEKFLKSKYWLAIREKRLNYIEGETIILQNDFTNNDG